MAEQGEPRPIVGGSGNGVPLVAANVAAMLPPQQQQQQQPPADQLAAGGGAHRPLIGRAGFMHISESLKKNGPDKTIADMQRLHGLAHPLCRPLLELMDHLQVTRHESHMHVLTRARGLLLDFVRQLAKRQHSASTAAGAANDARQAALAAREEQELQGRLESLLSASFPYLGMPELKQVPLEVLNSMERVPAPFLKLLAEDREVFNSLPQKVKQQVWEYDKGLLQSVAIETIATYKYEAATLLSCLDMRQFVGQRPLWEDDDREEGGGKAGGTSAPGGAGGGAPLPPRPGARPGGGGSGGGVARGGVGGGGFQLSSLLSKMGGAGTGKQGQQQQQRPQPPAGGSHLGPRATPPRRVSSSPARGSSPGTGPAAGAATQHGWDRRRLRAGSDAVKRLRAMVGVSGKIYSHLLELCEIRLHTSDAPYLSLKELSYCALRTQLLMALHDAGADALLRSQDACYDLVWTLDAAVGQRRVGVAHLRRLQEMFQPYQSQEWPSARPAGIASHQPQPQQHLRPPQQQQQQPPHKRQRVLGPGSLLASAPAIARTGLPQRSARRNRRAVVVGEGEDWGDDEEDDEDWGGGAAPVDESSSGGELSDDGHESDQGMRPPRPAARGGGAAVGAGQQLNGGRQHDAGGGGGGGGGGRLAGGGGGGGAPVVGIGDDDKDDEDFELDEDDEPEEDLDESDLDEGPARRRRKGAGRGRGAVAAAGRRRSGGSEGDGVSGGPAARKRQAAGMHEVGGSFVGVPAGSAVGPAAATVASLAAGAPSAAGRPPEAEEDGIGRSARQQDRWLAQAGMALRDPPTQHLLAAAVVGRLHRCVDERTLPRADLALSLMLQLLQLGVDARRQLRDRRYSMPPAPTQQLAQLWPQVVDMLAESALDPRPDDEERERQHGSEEGWQELVAGYKADEAVRKVVQMMALDRLCGHDLATARLLMTLMHQSGHWSFRSALPEYAPFAYSLAGELQDLVRAGVLHPGSSFWRLAFEGVLLELLDAHSQVHSECLRLLLLVAKDVPGPTLAAHLEHMLAATRESRATARHRKHKYHEREARARKEAEEFEQLAGDYLFSAGGGGLQSEWSDGFRAVRSLKYGTDENFSDLYKKVIFVGGLAESALPPSVRSFLREL